MCFKIKAIQLIILWSFLAYFSFYFTLRSFLYNFEILNLLKNISSKEFSIGSGAFFTLIYLFYPLGGLIGDVKCGQYKIIKRSLMFFTITSIMLIMVYCLQLVYIIKNPNFFQTISGKVAISALSCCHVVIGAVGFVAFFANIIPFAMDQLCDLPAQESKVFIYWYVWTLYMCSLLTVFIYNVVLNCGSTSVFRFSFSKCTDLLFTTGVIFMIATSILAFIALVTSLIVMHQMQGWFNMEHRINNPYKLVYKVTAFAYHHKIPVRRSAFTYCEDYLPSRLDHGKSKYGGPFSTEQVEDVKVFYEILKVLVSFGPFLYFVLDTSLYSFGEHLSFINLSNSSNSSQFVFYAVPLFYNDFLSFLLIVAGIPIYLYFRQCFIFHSFPFFRSQSLRKMEIGSIIVLIKLLFMMGVDIAAHVINKDLGCMFKYEDRIPSVFSPVVVMCILSVQQVLSALSQTIYYIAFIEFVCAQSPHSMKGMLIGFAYANLGFFQLLGKIIEVPFSYWKYLYPSCGLIYYTLKLSISLATFMIFVRVANRYTYRKRDELSREREYAEEYYSNAHQEPHYDYSTSIEGTS